jgi:protein-S-isoprenylcysteine O-methyltransferase Ste14
MDIQEKKIEFLYKALEDTQQTTRFVDTKTSVTTFVVGFIVAILSTGLSDFSDYFWNMPPRIQAIFIILILSVVIFIALTIHCAIQVVFPKTNPSEHVVKTTALKNLFYLNEIKKNNGITVIHPTYEDYILAFNSITGAEDIICELAYELQKVSYIRESKIAKVREMKYYLRVTLAVLPLLLFMHYWGLSNYKTKDNRLHQISIRCTK